VLFNSRLFVFGFLPVACLGFHLAGKCGRRAGLVWLLGCSLLFYAWWTPVLLLLLVASILVNFVVGRRVGPGAAGARYWLLAGLGFDLGLLGLFKYGGFVAGNLGLHWGGVLLPLGISFFTFQQIMYLVDTAKGESAAAPFLDYACFVAFFPHLIAGPLVRPSHILPQLARLDISRARLAAGLEIFILGLAKKIVLADAFGRLADPGFAAAAHGLPLTLIEAWVALLAYALEIYFDFSGYSDMAIGLAAMFGIEFPVNFDSPYRATSIAAFWRRWNITLGAFLRTYVYVPLGGNRAGEGRQLVNLMVTMLLGGLWHGAAWRFVLWGALHGMFLAVQRVSRRAGLAVPLWFSWALTWLCVVLAWVPFRAAGWAAAMGFYRGLFGGNGVAIPVIFVQLVPALAHVGRVVPALPNLGDARTLSLPQAILLLGFGWFVALARPGLHRMGQGGRSFAVVASFAFSLQALVFQPFAVPFLYFQF
jgi:D-alanyl-lipoteichoic acid acyltransferase DltB (MBOAT superfamily)